MLGLFTDLFPFKFCDSIHRSTASEVCGAIRSLAWAMLGLHGVQVTMTISSKVFN